VTIAKTLDGVGGMDLNFRAQHTLNSLGNSEELRPTDQDETMGWPWNWNTASVSRSRCMVNAYLVSNPLHR
jgi:hypothetical protein